MLYSAIEIQRTGYKIFHKQKEVEVRDLQESYGYNEKCGTTTMYKKKWLNIVTIYIYIHI